MKTILCLFNRKPEVLAGGATELGVKSKDRTQCGWGNDLFLCTISSVLHQHPHSSFFSFLKDSVPEGGNLGCGKMLT